ncbi:CLUMA_CG004786, isoform A [Clunio marinus]|uniref:CLUMA_CG004786, isoform A n=1 Tax=Clunio marinus TaxID=568069 RepID=A0A1J1HU65_9DIPT|nr:CLUMA_CG004786, isoform A [Clunio marinus]
MTYIFYQLISLFMLKNIFASPGYCLNLHAFNDTTFVGILRRSLNGLTHSNHNILNKPSKEKFPVITHVDKRTDLKLLA